jgi:soluble lytic murein transglycosylase-like protein
MAASHAAGLDPILVLALIKIESNFDPKAVSSAGAIGLTQIIPFWHADKGVTAKSALNPEFSIHAGVKILVEYLGWHKGDLRKALLQYNGSLKIKGAKYADNVLSMKTKINNFVESQRYEQAQGSSVQTADWVGNQWIEPSQL